MSSFKSLNYMGIVWVTKLRSLRRSRHIRSAVSKSGPSLDLFTGTQSWWRSAGLDLRFGLPCHHKCVAWVQRGKFQKCGCLVTLGNHIEERITRGPVHDAMAASAIVPTRPKCFERPVFRSKAYEGAFFPCYVLIFLPTMPWTSATSSSCFGIKSKSSHYSLLIS